MLAIEQGTSCHDTNTVCVLYISEQNDGFCHLIISYVIYYQRGSDAEVCLTALLFMDLNNQLKRFILLVQLVEFNTKVNAINVATFDISGCDASAWKQSNFL